MGTLAAALISGTAGGSVATWYWRGQAGSPARPDPAKTHSAGLPVMQLPIPVEDIDIPTLFREVAPSVVGVEVSSRRGAGQGTGFIVTNDGQALTNSHVIDNAQSIKVLLKDGTKVNAKLAGQDVHSDLAVLHTEIPSHKVQVARLGDSDSVRPGDPIIAIGSPFGFEHSVSHGIISGTDRTYQMSDRSIFGLLQTDAPINPGNSGGPLLDSSGEVIGIATMIQSPVPGSVGVGFAIPVNRARALLPRLVVGEKIHHPWIGISYSELSPELAKRLGLEIAKGLAVRDVATNSPAERSGVKAFSVSPGGEVTNGDIIVAVDGKNLASDKVLAHDLQEREVGDTVLFTILRDGKLVEIPVTLAAWPDRMR